MKGRESKNKLTHIVNNSKPISGNMSLFEKSAEYRGKQIKISVEFPTTMDEKVETEFQRLVKNIWLRKYEIGSLQSGASALQSHPPKEGGTEL